MDVIHLNLNLRFESSVIFNGSQTADVNVIEIVQFESSVIFNGSQTGSSQRS